MAWLVVSSWIADVDLLGRQVKVKPLDAIDLIDFTAPKFILLVDRKYQPEQFASKLEKLFNNLNRSLYSLAHALGYRVI